MTDLDDTVVAPTCPVARLTLRGGPDTEDTAIGLPSHAVSSRLIDSATTDEVVVAEHYRFRIGEHSDPIELDSPAYLGRRPSPPRIQTGTRPRLVVVQSLRHEVSSTHLELRQVGASVIVTDMRSTNGSVVMIPGNTPQKLRQGESLVISPGTLVDIGDGNIVEILPMQRLFPRASMTASSIPEAGSQQ